jgi:hypothetical protein
MGLYLVSFIFTDKFRKKLRLGELSPAEERCVLIIGRVGHAARGIVIALIGLFLIQAARHADPAEARGLGGVLDALAHQPYGPWLLGAVAAGLMAYGVHQFVSARYRQVWNPRPGSVR